MSQGFYLSFSIPFYNTIAGFVHIELIFDNFKKTVEISI